MGEQLKTKINKKYKYLQIDIDYVFKKMLLLKKKKYAALKVISFDGGKLTTQREEKGIDLVRRDWSIISRKAGNELLRILFSEDSRDDFREKFGTYLQQLSTDMREGRVDLNQYEITKSLTRSLSEYDTRNTGANPHVVVALRLKEKGQMMNISLSCLVCFLHVGWRFHPLYHMRSSRFFAILVTRRSCIYCG